MRFRSMLRTGIVRPARHDDIADQAIATTVNRLDVPWFPGVVVQSPAELPDAYHETAVGHGGPRPRGVEQDLLRDEAARVVGEATENGEGLWTQRNGTRATQQAFVPRIEARTRTVGSAAMRHARPSSQPSIREI
jgi:hypothetical protein